MKGVRGVDTLDINTLMSHRNIQNMVPDHVRFNEELAKSNCIAEVLEVMDTSHVTRTIGIVRVLSSFRGEDFEHARE